MASSAQESSSNANQMNNFDSLDEHVQCTSPRSSRKRKVDVTNHARTITKKRLHSGEGKTPTLNCAHTASTFCEARTLLVAELTYNFERLYNNKTKVEQDQMILSLMTIQGCKRSRVDEANMKRSKGATITYHLLRHDNSRIEVCKATFTSVLGK